MSDGQLKQTDEEIRDGKQSRVNDEIESIREAIRDLAHKHGKINSEIPLSK